MSKPGPRTPNVVIVVLLAAFVAAGIAAGRDRGGSADQTKQVVAEVDTIAHDVEQIRKLNFKKLPEPVVVTPEQTRKQALADVDKKYPEEKRRTDAELLELLGLVPAGTDLRKVT